MAFNTDLLKLLTPIKTVFERLEQSENPTLQLVAPSYFILAKMCATSINDAPIILVNEDSDVEQAQDEDDIQENDPESVDDPFDALRDIPAAAPVEKPSSLDEEYENYGKFGMAVGNRQNALEFWKANAATFPLLSQTARHYLVTPACSSQSERDFFHLGVTLTSRRAKLAPDTLDALEFLHGAYHAKLIK